MNRHDLKSMSAELPWSVDEIVPLATCRPSGLVFPPWPVRGAAFRAADAPAGVPGVMESDRLFVPLQLSLPPMCVFAIGIELPLDVTVQGSHDADARKHRPAERHLGLTEKILEVPNRHRQRLHQSISQGCLTAIRHS